MIITISLITEKFDCRLDINIVSFQSRGWSASCVVAQFTEYCSKGYK